MRQLDLNASLTEYQNYLTNEKFAGGERIEGGKVEVRSQFRKKEIRKQYSRNS